MSDIDSFTQNILGVNDLVSNNTNKADDSGSLKDPVGSLVDALELKMTDEELIEIKTGWEQEYAPYGGKIEARQNRNKTNYLGLQQGNGAENDLPVASNLLFEAEETFIPQALAKNPEPVVWSDNTEEGKAESNDIKTMLQYHADTLVLNRTMGIMLRHWSLYLVGIIKHGWDAKGKDITSSVRNPKNFIFDPKGYVDVKGCFVGAFLGERIESSAQEIVDMFPNSKDYILLKVSKKMGTRVVRTEWWTDDYCFTTLFDKVLDKHKNEFFKRTKKDSMRIMNR
jgi:hypothetical protein